MEKKIKTILDNVKENLPRIISFICMGVFVFSLAMIALKLYGYYRDDANYKKIREQVNSSNAGDKFAEVFSTTQASTATVSVESETAAGEINTPQPLPYEIGVGNIAELSEDGILLDYVSLKGQNKDLIGWIRIPGYKKEIDYPVMQSEDNEYYLKHDFYGNVSQAGSIYMDFRNNPLDVDRHIILYGHAMKDMSMFGNLKDLPDKPEKHAKNTKIYLDLLNTRLEYEIFSTYYAEATFNYRQTEFGSDEEYLAFIEMLRSKSVYDYNTTLTGKDKIITLSTCNNDIGGDIRSVTHARLVRQIVYTGGMDGADTEATNTPASREVVSANVYLTQLSLEYLSEGKPQKAVLKPAFSSGIKEYDTVVPSDVEYMKLVFEKADPEAVTEVSLNDQKADVNSLALNYGDNILKLKITSRDGKFSRIITVKIVRTPLPSPSPTPASEQVETEPREAEPSEGVSSEETPAEPEPAAEPEKSTVGTSGS